MKPALAFYCALLIIPAPSIQAIAMNDASNSTDYGKVEIISVDDGFSYPFNLSRFKPDEDSCVDLFINFQKPAGAWACFSFHRDKQWDCEGIGYADAPNHQGTIKVNVSTDDKGNLFNAVVLVGAKTDSLPAISPNITRRGDVPISGDSTKSFQFSFERKPFLCKPHVKEIVVERIFSYPVDYMRREPARLNYPELSMFHYGPSVRMPDIESVHTRAFMMNYWHILHPDEPDYNIPKKEK